MNPKQIGDMIVGSIIRVPWPTNNLERARIMFSSFFLHLHPVKSRRAALKATYTFGLGFLSFYLFLVLTLTGALLMLYYVPSTELAYQSMQELATEVNFGILFRNLHKWSAEAMVLVVFLHMLRVFYTGAYKAPREFNWGIGVILMIVTLLLSFTGYLLPWDQLSYWAVVVGSNIGGEAPFLGNATRTALIGGATVGQETLIRFYVLHVMILPLALAFLVAIHFWRVRKDGFTGPQE
jgi:quinol-cytochrome oxidoreductase complex cytochrome b subunit